MNAEEGLGSIFIILGDIKYIRRIEYINQPHKEIETGRNYFEFMTNLK